MIKKLALFAALALVAAPASALEMKQTFREADGGKLIINQLSPSEKSSCGDIQGYPCLTLSAAITNALLHPYADEPNLTGQEKLKRAEIALKANSGTTADFSPEEISLIKNLVGKLYSPLVVLRVYKALEPGPRNPK